MKTKLLGALRSPLTYAAIVGGTIGLYLWAFPLGAYIAGLWAPFTPERVTVPIEIVGGAKLLNRPGPAEFTDISVQAPTVITVSSRAKFLERATASDRVETAFTLGQSRSDSAGDPARHPLVHVSYAAHGREITYLWSETVHGPNGKNRRGGIDFGSFAFESPATFVWTTEEHDAVSRGIASFVLGLLALLATVVPAAFSAALAAFALDWVKKRPSKVTPSTA